MKLNIKKVNPISLILSLYIIISPFLVYYYGKSPYEFPKFIFSLIIAQILAVIIVFQKTDFNNKLIKLIVSFVVINLIANLLGLDPRVSLLGGEYRLQGFLLIIVGFIFAISSHSLSDKATIYKAIILSSILIAFITIYQFAVLNLGGFVPNYNGRIVATLGNPNFIGAYLVMALPFLLFSNLKKPIKWFFVYLLLFSILISFSLSAYLAILAELIIYLFYILKQKQKNIHLIKTAALITLVCIFLFSLNKSIIRFSPWDNRFIIWNHGLKSILNKPILGVGQENFELIVANNLHYKVDNAHNIFLEIAVSSGLFGLLVYLLIIKLALKNSNLELKMAVIGFIVVGFFNPLPIISLNLFWILIGASKSK